MEDAKSLVNSKDSEEKKKEESDAKAEAKKKKETNAKEEAEDQQTISKLLQIMKNPRVARSLEK
jgi:hypothetical protein